MVFLLEHVYVVEQRVAMFFSCSVENVCCLFSDELFVFL